MDNWSTHEACYGFWPRCADNIVASGPIGRELGRSVWWSPINAALVRTQSTDCHRHNKFFTPVLLLDFSTNTCKQLVPKGLF